MFPLGESTFALDEEMLQVLDAVDSVKPAPRNACPTTVNKDAHAEPAPSAVFAFSRADRAPQSTGQGPHRDPSTQERVRGRSGDCKRPGWRADCKDLAQRLLFSEDSEEVEHAQRGPESIQPSPPSACINGLSCQEIKNGQQVGSSTK